MSNTPITPATLAAEIGITPKVLRSYLRKAYPRTPEVKNTTWLITDEAAKAAKAKFAKQATA